MKQDLTRSSFTTLYQRCVLRRWRSWIQEKNKTTKKMILLVHNEELYWNRPCTMDARIPQALKREHPTPILASAGRIAAMKSIVVLNSTVQQEDHTSKEAVKKLIINSKRIPIERRWKPTWGKITSTTHWAKSRRTWSAAWETWSTSSCVPKIRCPHCLTYDEKHCLSDIQRKALYIVISEFACVLQTKRATWTGIDFMRHRFQTTW